MGPIDCPETSVLNHLLPQNTQNFISTAAEICDNVVTGIPDQLSEVSKFQHHSVLSSICSTLLGFFSLNLSLIFSVDTWKLHYEF
jgi:hypothetical protein